jgi:hypothetical protein
MNNLLLLLAGLVLVVCLMNSKDLMKSDLVKSVSSKVKSMKMDDTTLLVVIFVVVVLFMCMNKRVEGFTGLVNGECPNGTKMHVYNPNGNPNGNPKEKSEHTPVCFNNKSELDVFKGFKDLYEKAKPVTEESVVDTEP